MKTSSLLMNCTVCLLPFIVASPFALIGAEPAASEAIDGFRDTPIPAGSKWHLHDPDRPQPPVVTPGAAFSQNVPAPSDAEVLFDGQGSFQVAECSRPGCSMGSQGRLHGDCRTARHPHARQVGRFPIACRV